MPTPFESAQLLLTLYDQRREDLMRKARGFVLMWDPQTLDEVMDTMAGPNSGLVRMVVTYWDMAASFVEHGAIDRQMFNDVSGEHVLVYGKVQPFLPQIREAFGNPGYLKNLEKLVMAMPDAQKTIDARIARVRAMIARSAANSRPD